MRYRLLGIIFIFSICALWTGCRSRKPLSSEKRPQITVSLAPYRYFVERIGGDLFDVVTIVPPGADPHTFEATPRQMESVVQSQLWFSIGEPFERRLQNALKSQTRDLMIADLREAWDRPAHAHVHDGEVGGPGRCCTCHLEDRHFWMSPKRAGQQAQFIAKAMSRAFPEHRELFERRLAVFKQDLDKLTKEISLKLAPLEDRWVLVSHPAIGYFCEDFDLHQLSLEIDGKEATPQQLAHLLEQAKHLPVSCIMTQQQHNPAGAQWVASQLGLSSELIDPYHPDVLNNLRHIAEVFVRTQRVRQLQPSEASWQGVDPRLSPGGS
jgi:zinc transport system substrate-binding protein